MKTGLAMTWMVLCAAAMLQAQSVSVAVVDLEDLVRLHPNTTADKKLLEQTLKEYKGEGDDLQRKLEALQEDFEKARKEAQDPALSEKARKVAEEAAGKKGGELSAANRQARDRMQTLQQQLSEQQVRMVKRTTSEIRSAVDKYATEHKILLVLPASAVLYQEKTLDITDAIMKRMNIQRPPPAADTGASDTGEHLAPAPAGGATGAPKK